MNEVLNDGPEVIDDFLEPEVFSQLSELLKSGRWTYGWRSSKGHGYGLWHCHLAGGDKNSRSSCDAELGANLEATLVNQVWRRIKESHLPDCMLLRAYVNGQTFGLEGGIHVDSTEKDECVTAILYVHSAWAVSWGGETVFYTEDGEILTAVFPEPGRLVLFDSALAHAARAPSRECPALRTALVFKARRTHP